MTSIDWPTPQPEPLTFISPTRGEDLRTCPRRVAYLRDPAYKALRRTSEHALAGLVAHAVYERIATGNYSYPVNSASDEVLDQVWSEETLKAYRRFARSWTPAVVPDPEQWPHMARTRRAILRTQTDRLIPGTTPPTSISSSSRRTAPPQQDLVSQIGPLPWVEKRLTDDVHGIEGTPDRVERTSDGVWILDLKTGWDQDEATQLQRQQLLVYLHLVATVLGSEPAGAALDTRRGRFAIETSKDEIAAAVSDLTQLRNSFNEVVNAGGTPTAHPSPDTCRWCTYRLVCQPCSETITEGDRVPLVVIGTVIRRDSAKDRTVIDLQMVFPSWRMGAPTRVVDVAWASLPEVGDVVALAGVHSSSDGRTLSGSWKTITFNFTRRRTRK